MTAADRVPGWFVAGAVVARSLAVPFPEPAPRAPTPPAAVVAAVGHALAAEGAASLFERPLEVHAGDGSPEGRRQFRVLFAMRPGAEAVLAASPRFRAGRGGHVFQGGRLTRGLRDYRLKGGPPSLHISVSEDGSTADVDIDYRRLLEGHLRPSNSDPWSDEGGIDNRRRHERRWGPLSRRP